MTDHQGLIFGSFTEEEIRSIQSKPLKNNVALTFGSFDSETLRSVGIFSTGFPEFHPSKIYGLPKHINTGPVVSFPSSTGYTSNLKVTFLEENGFVCNLQSGVKNQDMCHIEPSVSASSLFASDVPNQLPQEQREIHDVSEVSFSLSAINLDDSSNGVGEVECDDHIFKELNVPSSISRNFMPRGLVNLGNLCFLNATLQALLSCSPFFELLQELRHRTIPEIGYPTLRAFVEFISNFDMITDSICKSNEKTNLGSGEPFRPVMFDSILKSFTPDVPDNLSGRPRQEDAQEFLSFVMHQMHDELLKHDGQVSNGNGKSSSLVSSTDNESEDENWETVAPKNRTAITRTQSFIPSKLSVLFGGQLRSVVKARGNKASATIQPYLLLHLNICPDPVSSIEDALRLFSEPETLEGYRISAAGKAELVTASKSVKILQLSEILVLHLMRFSYGSQGSTKLHKNVHFPLELVVDHELLSSPSSEGQRYELVATITHHGRDSFKGHYTADARHPSGKWLRYDDASVTSITESQVLHDQAYVLFYKQL